MGNIESESYWMRGHAVRMPGAGSFVKEHRLPLHTNAALWGEAQVDRLRGKGTAPPFLPSRAGLTLTLHTQISHISRTTSCE
jgi:hypothetical protein